MTKEQQVLAMWGGGALVVLIAVWIFLGGRAENLTIISGEAATLHQSYAKLYPEEGRPSREALEAGKLLRDHQTQALTTAEKSLIATVPEDYRRTDVNQAGSRLSADLATLRQRAQRQKVALPAQLPFERGLEADEGKRALQLTQLFVYKTVLELAMDAGFSRITAIKEGVPYRDASSTYAVVPCEISVDGNYEAVVQLLDTLRARHTQGLGVRDLKLVQGAQGVQATLLMTFITLHDPVWGLTAAAAPAAAGGRGSTPTAGTRPGPLLGGG